MRERSNSNVGKKKSDAIGPQKKLVNSQLRDTPLSRGKIGELANQKET